MINRTMADTLFGSSNSIFSGSFLSASNLGDLTMMRNGTYTKLLRSYYEKVDDSGSTKKSKSTGKDTEFKNAVSEKLEKLTNRSTQATEESVTNKQLSNVKSSASGLETAAGALMEMDFDTAAREEIYGKAKDFVKQYNSVLSSANQTDNVSISQSVTWMKNDTKAHEKMLGRVGITVGTDGTLSIDEEKFNKANLSDIKSQMSDSSSIVGRTAQRAAGLYNLAANQISFSQGSLLYSSSGVLK